MSTIITAIFLSFIGSINTLLVVPFINTILNLFPNLSTYVTYFFDFLELASTYLTTILRLLLFTRGMMVLLFGYYMIKWSIWVLACTIRSVIKIYNLLKV